MSTTPDEVARDVIGRLEQAWNNADGTAFGEPFAEDAEFVDIRGTHHSGRRSIVEGHEQIFASIYKGSRVRYEPIQTKMLGDEVMLVHNSGQLDAPSGPMAGTHRAMQSLILVRNGEKWEVASFHNTLVAPGS